MTHLYVSVGEEQIHDDVLRQNLRVVDAQFDSRQFLGQFLTLILISSFSDVIQQRVFERSALKKRKKKIKNKQDDRLLFILFRT